MTDLLTGYSFSSTISSTSPIKTTYSFSSNKFSVITTASPSTSPALGTYSGTGTSYSITTTGSPSPATLSADGNTLTFPGLTLTKVPYSLPSPSTSTSSNPWKWWVWALIALAVVIVIGGTYMLFKP
jgi:hypothetical protein